MNLYGLTNQFRFHLDCEGNTMGVLGTLQWDKEKRRDKATIIAQKEPEIRYEAWADRSATAALLCIAQWSGSKLHAEPCSLSKPPAPLTAAMPNTLASKLGAVALQAASSDQPVGDSIDRGLILLRLLEEAGFILSLAPDNE